MSHNRRLAGTKILLVDDEADVRTTFRLLLGEIAGAEVVEACDGLQALELHRNGHFDCVITDFNMPGMKGDALAKAIKTANSDERVLMISGFADHVLVDGGAPWFIDAILPKPVNFEQLLNTVEKLLKRDNGHFSN